MNSIFKSIQRSWTHHFGTQFSTLIVLCGAFSVIVCTMLISQNLTRVLASWGETVQVTAYLEESSDESVTEKIATEMKKLTEVAKIEYVDRDMATTNFKEQMASYAPGLLSDSDFANPFPASFRVTLNDGAKPEKLREVSEAIRAFDGIEEVSYGQSWVANYSTFAKVISNFGQALVVLLLAGGLMIVGNSVRASVAVRREDVEILELVGATKGMIRTPFLVEGALIGLVAAAMALVLNFALYSFAIEVLSESLGFMRFTEILSFASLMTVVSVLTLGAAVGLAGAYFAVRSLNDGWSASRRGRA